MPEELAKILKDEVMKAKEYISKLQIEKNVCMEKKKLFEILELLRGAVMIAYPGYHGLPYWEPVVEMLENKINYLAVFPDCEVLPFWLEGDGLSWRQWVEKEEATLWWAGKELMKGKFLRDYIGKNEKTKAVPSLNELMGKWDGLGGADNQTPVKGSWGASSRAPNRLRDSEEDDGLLLQEAGRAKETGRRQRGRLPEFQMGQPKRFEKSAEWSRQDEHWLETKITL